MDNAKDLNHEAAEQGETGRNGEHEHPDRRHVPIFIDNVRRVAPRSHMTGAELKTLGEVPSNYQLFLEVPGPGADRGIRDDEVVEVHPQQRFHSVPAGTLGMRQSART
jgi:Multiubiquitin